MNETDAGLGGSAPEGSTIASGPDAGLPTSSHETTETDPGNYEARIRSDPEFAVAEVKRQQAAASRAYSQLKPAKGAIDIANALGGGDPEKGSIEALNRLTLHNQMLADPTMRSYMERFVSGQPIAPPQADGSGYDPGFEAMDPQSVELRALREQVAQQQGTVARLEQDQLVSKMVGHFETVMSSDIGKALLPDEQKAVFGTIENQIKAWSQTEAGRGTLRNMDASVVKTLVANHLMESGKLLEIGERAARQRAERLQSRTTDVLGAQTASASTQSMPEGVSALEALRIAKQRLGVH